jgi:hypothetical protein
MRRQLFVAFFFSAVVFPLVGSAQVYRNETPPPSVTAAGTAWQMNGAPIFYAGSYYYPAGATVFFDGKVMARTGVFEGVPLYSDVTLEPFSIVYVPVGGAVMRPYERRREGELTGTVGSRTPSFPIDRDVELSARSGTLGLVTPAVVAFESEERPEAHARYVLVPVTALRQAQYGAQAPAPPEPEFTAAGVVSIAPTTRSNGSGGTGAVQGAANAAQPDGLWIQFENARWFSAGRAVDYDASRFQTLGDYRGFPVYRERAAAGERIYVTVVHDGPVAPFERR